MIFQQLRWRPPHPQITCLICERIQRAACSSQKNEARMYFALSWGAEREIANSFLAAPENSQSSGIGRAGSQRNCDLQFRAWLWLISPVTARVGLQRLREKLQAGACSVVTTTADIQRTNAFKNRLCLCSHQVRITEWYMTRFITKVCNHNQGHNHHRH